MRSLVLLTLAACAAGTSDRGIPVRPVDRDEPTDDPSNLPNVTDSSQGLDSVAPPPLQPLEHVCSGTEPYWYVWPVPPISFYEAPKWGVWQYRSATDDAGSEPRWSFVFPQPDLGGVLSSYCYCERDGSCSSLTRHILVPINP